MAEVACGRGGTVLGGDSSPVAAGREPAWPVEQHVIKGNALVQAALLLFMHTGPRATGTCHPRSGKVFPQVLKTYKLRKRASLLPVLFPHVYV